MSPRVLQESNGDIDEDFRELDLELQEIDSERNQVSPPTGINVGKNKEPTRVYNSNEEIDAELVKAACLQHAFKNGVKVVRRTKKDDQRLE